MRGVLLKVKDFLTEVFTPELTEADKIRIRMEFCRKIPRSLEGKLIKIGMQQNPVVRELYIEKLKSLICFHGPDAVAAQKYKDVLPELAIPAEVKLELNIMLDSIIHYRDGEDMSGVDVSEPPVQSEGYTLFVGADDEFSHSDHHLHHD